MPKKLFLAVCFFLAIQFLASAQDLTVEDVIQKLQANQSKIQDMYAETTTTIISNISVPGAKDKGPQEMTQKGRIWTKGNKSKMEQLSPTKQITINDGKQMAVINPDTGQKYVQDLRKLQGGGVPNQAGGTDFEKAKEYFEFSVKRGGTGYIITGVPRKQNKFLGKMEFYVDSDKWVATRIMMYGAKDKLMSQSEIEYEEISGVWVPTKNVSSVNSPIGKMNIEMVYENVRVNKGMSDGEFKI
jgi:outer membrane lipoprotein-sorting protein